MKPMRTKTKLIIVFTVLICISINVLTWKEFAWSETKLTVEHFISWGYPCGFFNSNDSAQQYYYGMLDAFQTDHPHSDFSNSTFNVEIAPNLNYIFPGPGVPNGTWTPTYELVANVQCSTPYNTNDYSFIVVVLILVNIVLLVFDTLFYKLVSEKHPTKSNTEKNLMKR
jgi:hypothetical protein